MTEHLIGEEMVTDDLSASLLADRCMEEARRLFNSKAEGWRKVEIMDPEINVEVYYNTPVQVYSNVVLCDVIIHQGYFDLQLQYIIILILCIGNSS